MNAAAPLPVAGAAEDRSDRDVCHFRDTTEVGRLCNFVNRLSL
jgi:hypothetical protein